MHRCHLLKCPSVEMSGMPMQLTGDTVCLFVCFLFLFVLFCFVWCFLFVCLFVCLFCFGSVWFWLVTVLLAVLPRSLSKYYMIGVFCPFHKKLRI